MSVRGLRAAIAAEKRQERLEQKRLRDAERNARETERLSEFERARAEVEAHNCKLASLLSVHKDTPEVIDWMALAARLAPVQPGRTSHQELRARRGALLATVLGRRAGAPDQDLIAMATTEDDANLRAALKEHSKAQADWLSLRDLARRIVRSDTSGFKEAFEKLDPTADTSDLYVSSQLLVHSRHVAECRMVVQGIEVIPAEVKSLTARGKLSTKAMPKAQFHETFQDYVCGCVLRMAREILALLPLDRLIVTASVDDVDTATGRGSRLPVLSAILPRSVLATFDWEQVDPSDAIESLAHRGDVKRSRKSGTFTAIAPFTLADLPDDVIAQNATLTAALASAGRLRSEMAQARERLASPDKTSRE